LLDLRGPTSKGREWKERERRGGDWEREEKRGGEGGDPGPPTFLCLPPPMAKRHSVIVIYKY